MQSQRWQNLRSQCKPFNITVIQVYAPTTNAREDEAEQFNEDLQDFLKLTPKKDVLFIIGDGSAKEIPAVTWKFGFNSTECSSTKANGVWPREPTGPCKHPLPTTQETTLHVDITG